MRYGLIRLDIEDFLTPEADQALKAMLDRLESLHLPASLGFVGEKVTAMVRRDQEAVLRQAGRHKAIGFHSATHSRHPTLAEELDQLDYEPGVRRFIDRERMGVEAVARAVAPPRFFTQPGANWVPHAAEALPQLGISIYFSEALNSYLVPLTQPVWLGETLHFSPPVPTPLPFLHGLPDNLEAALDRLKRVPEEIPEGSFFCLMMHPTELVTTQFWDAVNFGRGRTPAEEQAAPLRSSANREAALAAFTRYLQEAKALSGVQWVDVVTVSERVQPRQPEELPRALLDEHVGRCGLYPLRHDRGVFSAAQLVWALAYFALHPGQSQVKVPLVGAPRRWTPRPWWQGAWTRSEALAAAEAWVHGGTSASPSATATLPDQVGPGVPIELAAASWWEVRQGGGDALPRAQLPLTFLAYVKDPVDLHWRWPIFAPDFRPFRLWMETRRLAWTIAPVRWREAETYSHA